MKKIFWLLLISLLLSTSAIAQTQTGYVKTKGRKGTNGAVVPGTRISGATVQVKGRTAVVTQSNGTFSFPIPANKFFIQNVKKQGYVLTDPEVLTKQYVFSPNPLILVLETPEQKTDDKLASERKIRRTLQRRLQQREDEIEELKEQNKLTREEYQKALQQLYAEQETNEKLIGEMAERYSQIDYDLLDEFNTRISDCILEGRLAEADSLLRSKGDIKDRIAAVHQAEAIEAAEAAEIAQRQQKLEESKAGTQASKEDIAQDCFHFFEKFKLEHNNDSAAYYLAQRVLLDSTNVAWLRDAGQFASEYLANYPQAVNYLQRALSQAISQLGQDNVMVARIYNDLGMVYRKQGRFGDVMDCYKLALAIGENLSQDDGVVLAMTYNNIGLFMDYMGDSAKALEYFLKAIDIEEHTVGIENALTATSYNNVGALYYSNDDLDRAMEYFNKSLTIREKVLVNDHPDLAMSYSNIGSIYHARGDNSRALEYFNRALAIREQALGSSHPDVAAMLTNMGAAHLSQGNFQQALEFFNRSLAINERMLGSEHPDVAISYNNMGMVFEKQNDYANALQWYDKSLAIKEKSLGNNHPSTINTLENMGRIYFLQKDYDKALDCYSRGFKARETAHSDDKVGLAESCDNMGSTLYRQGEYAQALEYLLKGAAIREQTQGESHPSTLQTYQSLASAYGKLADYAKAIEYYQKTLGIIAPLKGEGSIEVSNLKKNILMNQYLLALSKGKLKNFLADHCFIGTVNRGDNPASAQGLSGEYVLLEFADWNQDCDMSLFGRADELRQSPKDIVVLKEGVISRHHFENKLGISFGVKQITKDEKQQINQAYKKWKEQ